MKPSRYTALKRCSSQALKPLEDHRGTQPGFGLLGKPQEIIEMPVTQVSCFTRFDQIVAGVLADGLQHRVARLILILLHPDQ